MQPFQQYGQPQAPQLDPATLAALHAQWQAQAAAYPAGHPSNGYQYPAPDAPPAATPSAAAAFGLAEQDTAAPVVASGGSRKSAAMGVLSVAFVLAATAGTAVAVGKLLDRLFAAADQRAADVEPVDQDHAHG